MMAAIGCITAFLSNMIMLYFVTKKVDSVYICLSECRTEIRKILERIAHVRSDLAATISYDLMQTNGEHGEFHQRGPGCNHHHCSSVLERMIAR